MQLGKARGHDADNALVPVLVVDYNGFLLRVHLAAGFEYGVGLLGDLLVELLAVLVILVDGLAKARGFLEIAGGEQLHGFRPALHAPRGVDARPDFEITSEMVISLPLMPQVRIMARSPRLGLVFSRFRP